jgi:hypothetical protein
LHAIHWKLATAGPPGSPGGITTRFERLIDHPGWIGKVRHFVGGAGTFDYNQA